ncbi:hypothetical protein [Streptomyces odonnellii]|uniref:hypothetical protein n=1 Tax=Streptomyces odonnellii TaxID=1417980 RepID=UPI000625C743|nr:hypothetical protein [Streptomyces odonnellii]
MNDQPKDPRQPAYDAVYALIRTLPPVADTAARNALIWRAATAALDGARVGHCVSSHCVEGGHVLMSRAEYDESRALPALLRTPEPDRTAEQTETVRPVWTDGDPTMEAVARAVWEQCQRSESGLAIDDDPRNIAAAAVAAVRTAAGQPADRAALRARVNEALVDHLSRTADIQPTKSGAPAFTPEITDSELRRIVDVVVGALPESGDRASTALAEVRRLCEMTITASVRVDAIDQARDTLAAIDRVMAAEAQQPTAAEQPVARREPPEPRCDVTFQNGTQCAKPADHRSAKIADLCMPAETLRLHERRTRWQAATRKAKVTADRAAALRIYMAAADEEQRQLRAELEDARRDADYFQGWADGNGTSLNTALADNARLRAEIEALTSVDADRCAALDRVRELAAAIDTPTWRAPGNEVAARIRLALSPSQEDLTDQP